MAIRSVQGQEVSVGVLADDLFSLDAQIKFGVSRRYASPLALSPGNGSSSSCLQYAAASSLQHVPASSVGGQEVAGLSGAESL